MTTQFDWRDALEQMFAATVNQETLEDAATLMVSVSAGDPEYHRECIEVLEHAERLARDHDAFVIHCINKSGYQVDGFDEAASIINELKSQYTRAYEGISK